MKREPTRFNFAPLLKGFCVARSGQVRGKTPPLPVLAQARRSLLRNKRAK